MFADVGSEHHDGQDEDQEDDVMSLKSKISELSIRPKHETLQEKKERKLNLKQFRRERRSEKKSNTEAFKSEKMKQEKIRLNTKNNLHEGCNCTAKFLQLSDDIGY